MQLLLRGNFGLEHERPRDQYFKEKVGFVVMGGSSLFYQSGKSTVVSDLLANESGWAMRLVPDSYHDSFRTQVIKVNETFRRPTGFRIYG